MKTVWTFAVICAAFSAACGGASADGGATGDQDLVGPETTSGDEAPPLTGIFVKKGGQAGESYHPVAFELDEASGIFTSVFAYDARDCMRELTKLDSPRLYVKKGKATIVRESGSYGLSDGTVDWGNDSQRESFNSYRSEGAQVLEFGREWLEETEWSDHKVFQAFHTYERVKETSLDSALKSLKTRECF